MALASKISLILSNKLGKIQGDIQARIQERTADIFSKLANQCPAKTGIISIASEINNLRSVTGKYLGIIGGYRRFGDNLNTIIGVTSRLVKVLKSVPIPTAVPPGFGITIGLTNRYSDLLRKADKRLEALENEQQAIYKMIDEAQKPFERVSRTFNDIAERINICIQELIEQEGETDELRALLQEIQSSVRSQSDVQVENESYRSVKGTDYILEIISDPNSTNKSIPLRYAQAKNNNGVVVLRGQSSYSSSTGILLEEIKFRIDNQLP